MSDQVEVLVAGERLIGWKTVEILRTIEGGADGFVLEMSELEEDDPTRRVLRRGDPVEIAIAEETVISGFIWKLAPSYSGSNHSVTVSGWDKTKDLAKASNLEKLKIPAKLEELVAQICKPFGISVSVDVDTGARFESFTPEVGATADSIIDHLVRYRGVIRVSDGVGGLLITLPGSGAAVAELTKGENILAAGGVFDDEERFSLIRLEAQRESSWGGDSAGASITAEATDPNVGRYLPLLEIPKDPPDGKVALQALAQREINLRAARGERIRVTVKGWRHQGDEGPIWNPGELVSVSDPWLGVNQDLLLASVALKFAKDKRRAVLNLLRPEAFDLRKLEEPKVAGLELWGSAGGDDE